MVHPRTQPALSAVSQRGLLLTAAIELKRPASSARNSLAVPSVEEDGRRREGRWGWWVEGGLSSCLLARGELDQKLKTSVGRPQWVGGFLTW